VDEFAESSHSSIFGVYFANERATDVDLSPFAVKLANKILQHNDATVLVQVGSLLLFFFVTLNVVVVLLFSGGLRSTYQQQEPASRRLLHFLFPVSFSCSFYSLCFFSKTYRCKDNGKWVLVDDNKMAVQVTSTTLESSLKFIKAQSSFTSVVHDLDDHLSDSSVSFLKPVVVK
jgi:hypothetical protein